MEDHIEPIGPLRIAVEFDFGFGPRATLVNDRHIDVRGGFEALLDDLFLAVVVMATAPDDQQGSDRLGGFRIGELTERPMGYEPENCPVKCPEKRAEERIGSSE